MGEFFVRCRCPLADEDEDSMARPVKLFAIFRTRWMPMASAAETSSP
jgi:hypothetical protein